MAACSGGTLPKSGRSLVWKSCIVHHHKKVTAVTLKINNPAPSFVGKDQDGNTVTLADFKGKKLVLYFYPKDNTPGCTAQACNLRDNYTMLQQAGYEVIGVSTDGAASHRRFITGKQLPFRLLTDEDHAIHEQYGVWIEKSMFGKKYWGTARVTFVIDEQGKIVQIIDRVKTSDHTSQILNVIATTS